MIKRFVKLTIKSFISALIVVAVSCFIPNPWDYPEEIQWALEDGEEFMGSDIFHFDVTYGETASVRYRGNADVVLVSGEGAIYLNDGKTLNNIHSPIGFTVVGESGEWNGYGVFEVTKDGKKQKYHIFMDDDRAIYF